MHSGQSLDQWWTFYIACYAFSTRIRGNVRMDTAAIGA